MTTKWQGDRLLAQIYVSHAGPDLCEQLEQTLRWLVGGHMQHVMVYLPGDSAAVAEAGPRLEEIGIFPAAWIPDFFRGKRDALLFQASVFRGLDESRIRTEGPEAGAIATRVYNAWKRTRAADTTLPPKV